jgi:hypothetical protein
MSIRLLSRTDCYPLPEAPTALSPGTNVAVLDLQVFVPEMISILSTFARLADSPLKGHFSFIERLIGEASPPAPVPVTKDVIASIAIKRAIEQSELEPLQRLSANHRTALAEKICQLTADANLYGTQLDAFVSSLSLSLHCTQGPPGTGKVIALHFII